MRSRTLSCDFRILWKDLTRFAPVWLGYSVVLLLMLHGHWDQGTDITDGYYDGATIFALINGVYGIVCAMSLFGYLTEPRECNMHHSLPVRREEYFLLHTLSGFLMSLIPTGLFVLGELPLASQGSLLVTFVMIELEFCFFFGLGVLCMLLTGRKIGAFTLYGLANVGSMLVYLMLETLFLPAMPSVVLPTEGFLAFCPVINIGALETDLFFIRSDAGEALAQAIGIYALAGLGMLGAALALYRGRKLERAGDFLAVRWLEPVLATAVSLAFGCVFTGFGSLFYADRSDFLLTVGLVVGWLGIWMLMRRTVKVFRPLILAGCAAVVITVFGASFFVEANSYLWTEYVPEPEQVEAVELQILNGYDNSLTVTDPENIGELTNAHADILRSTADGDFSHALYLTYHMKDGRTVRRYYQYINEGTRQIVSWYASQPEIQLEVSTLQELLDAVKWFGMDSYTTHREVLNSKDLTQEEITQLLTLLFQDCKAGNMYYSQPDEIAYCLNIEGDNVNNWVYIPKTALDTLAWIERHIR